MSFIMSLSLTTALLCGVWNWAAPFIGLFSWAGFSGCTSYFACPHSGIKGVIYAIVPILTGIFYGMISIYLPQYLGLPVLGLFMTVLVTFFMCIQSKIEILSYIPGAFFGCFSTFAAGGSLIVIPSMLVGVILGVSCDMSGKWLFERIGRDEALEEPTETRMEDIAKDIIKD